MKMYQGALRDQHFKLKHYLIIRVSLSIYLEILIINMKLKKLLTLQKVRALKKGWKAVKTDFSD